MAESNKAYNNLIARGFSNEQIRSMFGNIGIPEVDLSESAWEREFRESGENISNALSNIIPDLKLAWESTKTATFDLVKPLFGEETQDDIEEYIVDQYAKIQKIKSERADTGEGIFKGAKQGDVSDIVGGIANAFTGVTTTLIPAMLTRGASIYPQIMAPMITDFNEEKARQLYGDDPDRIKKLVEDEETDFVLPAVVGFAAARMEKFGLGGIQEYIAKNAIRGRGAAMLLTTGLRESGTELGQFAAETTNKRLAQGANIMEATWDGFVSMGTDEGIEAALQGFVGGTGIAGGGRIVSRALRNDSDGQKLVASSLRDLSKLNTKRGFTKKGSAEMDALDIEIKSIEDNLKTYLLDNQKISNLLNNEQKTELQNLIIEKDKIRNTLKALKSDFNKGDITRQSYGGRVKAVTNRYSQINNRISEIKNTVDITQYETQKQAVKEGAKIAGQKVQEISKEEKGKLLKEQGYKGQKLTSLKDRVAGMYNPRDKTLYIDKKTALEVGEINVAGHELLHPVFNKLIGDDAAQGRIVEDFKNQLTQEDLDFMEIEMVLRGNGVNSGKYNTEYINVFSDSITKNKVKFNDSVYSKIGDVIVGLFRGVGFKNISFDSGRGVYNFLKAYHQGLDTGKFDQDVLTILEKTKGMKDKLAEQQLSQAASDNVQNIYEQQGTAGAFDIIQEFKPIVNRLVEKRRQAPKFDRALLTEEIETGERGIIDLINEYKPESGVPLAAYINKFLPSRAIEASRRVLGEEFTTDITEVKDIAVEEVITPEVTKKPKARKIKPIDLVDDAKLKQKYTKDVQEKLKDVDVGKLTSKNLKDLSAKNTAKIFNVPVKKIIDPAANLTKQEKENALTFIRKNALDLIDLLPEGAITESASEKLIGTSTGVPKSLLNRFYTKQDRITKGAGLSPYTKNKNISKKDFLEAFGIIEGKKSTDFGPRTPEAQAVKSMMSLYGKLATNTIVRQTIKDKVSKEKIQDIAAGKSIIQFSESEASKDIKKIIGRPLDTKNTDDIQRIGMFFREILPKYMDPAIVLGRASLLSPGNKITTAFKRKFFFITNALKGKTNEIIRKNNEAVVAGEINNIEDIKTGAYDNYKVPKTKKEKEDERLMNIALSNKTSKKGDIDKIKKNIDNTTDHNKGVKILMNNILNIYKGEGKKSLPEIKELLFHVNNNTSISRNVANVVGGQKIYGVNLTEEHKYQAIVWTKRAIEAMKYGTLDGFLEWSEKNYIQLVLDENNNGFANKKYGDWYAKYDEHPLLKEAMDKAIKNGDFSKVPDSDVRYYDPKFFHLNPNNIIEFGKTHAEKYKVVVPKSFENDPDVIEKQAEIIFKIASKQDIDFNPQQEIDKFIAKDAKGIADIRSKNYSDFDFLFESMTLQEQIKVFRNLDKAFEIARNYNKTEKGISVFDFDQTLANTKEKVKYETLDGKKGTLTARQFAERAEKLEEQGVTFDFSNFDKVRGATKGPFFELAQKIKGKFGNKDIFILTARPETARPAIRAFLKSVGLDIKLDNIIGLEDGRPAAKANFIIEKTAEGYNNFFFGDDVYSNVKMVQDVLDIVDVKRDVQQARMQFSKAASNEFNKILEQTAGVKAEARFSDAAAKTRGAKSLPWHKRWFIPPSAEDFTGLLYHFVGKGKQGEIQMKFFKDKLIDPFARAYKNINAAKQLLANEFNALQKQYPKVKKLFKKDSGYNNFTNEQAIRVYLWNKNGIEIPGISKTDLKNLTKIVNNNSNMKEFADKLGIITRLPDGYIKPSDTWTGETIGSDIINVSNKENRALYMKEFLDNKELIFSKENLNKIEAIYGTSFRSSLEDILWRMENGTNRRTGQSKLVNQWTEWVNNSVGAIMFFNFRSAVLQTISAVNFVNWSDNNPLKAGAAIANFPQYAKDFATLFNSDMLKQRRAGLQTDVNASEMAESVAGSKNKVNAMIAYLLKKGFLPTQMADSFAIASGGATFYRNRINTYKKQGLSDKEAESRAFKDFQEISEVSQQSSRPDLISQQQAGPLGRLILAFQNTPMQYTRLMKKAALDLKNRRGDDKTNISKILYYGAVQNILFSALQNAMFGLMFEDEDEKVDDKYDKKKVRMLNNMSDTILRGIGVYGAAVSTIKNVVLKFIQEEKEGYRADHAYTVIEAINLSPPIGSKIRKIYSATQTYKFNRDEIKEKGFDIDSPAYGAVGNVISATTNVPTDRVYNIVNNAQAALDKNNAAWQRIAVALGWNKWDVGIKDLDKTKEQDKKDNQAINPAVERRRKIIEARKRKSKKKK